MKKQKRKAAAQAALSVAAGGESVVPSAAANADNSAPSVAEELPVTLPAPPAAVVKADLAGVSADSVPADSVPADSAPLARSERVPLIAGNWKLNFDHLQAIAFVQKLAWNLKDLRHDFQEVEVAVFPPFTDLRSVQTLLSADKMQISLGAQDVSQHSSGAHTGEVSAAMLQKLTTAYALVGHSERRQDHGETSAVVGLKAQACVKHEIVPVICVGETAADLAAQGAAAVPVAQLQEALAQLSASDDFVVAYEPVWAIGSGEAASAEQAENVAAKLRETIAAELDAATAEKTRIIYGGSVSSDNVAGFLRQPNIDGALVGGASLKVTEFSRIIQFKKHVTAA